MEGPLIGDNLTVLADGVGSIQSDFFTCGNIMMWSGYREESVGMFIQIGFDNERIGIDDPFSLSLLP